MYIVCAKEITSQGNVLSKTVKMVRQEAPRTKRSESLAPEILPPSGLWLTTRAGTIPYRGSWRAEKADVSCLPLQASVSAHTAQESHTHTHKLSYPSAFPAGLHSHWTEWFHLLLGCGLRARLQAVCACCLRDTWRPSFGPWAAAVWLKSSLSLRFNCCRYVAAKERGHWDESLSSNTVCV